MVNGTRERVISKFDTKTIRVSSSPATLSYLTRCLGSLYDDVGERMRNEEKGGRKRERKLQKDRYARGSEDETENEGEGYEKWRSERGRR